MEEKTTKVEKQTSTEEVNGDQSSTVKETESESSRVVEVEAPERDESDSDEE